ncbi:hypothetical protein PYW07_004863 [Mythimna separata]|uniref:Uncharacterized protein n=1 Tax=Mythimna separata TaxID=271217 RepID=A0AAD7YDS4_MYTSE|nr:hypothetical protein PYW07_004863 [Mythimna separata]
MLLLLLCVGVGAQQAARERFITLRDYDFVGEDATLAAQLARRLALLQAPLNLSELTPPARPPHPDVWQRWQRRPDHIKPDYLDSNLKLPQMVNVSLDYAEIFNVSESDWSRNTNASSSAPAPAAVQPQSLIPSPGATLVPGPYAAVARDLDSALGPNPAEGPSPDLSPGATPAPNASEGLGSVDGRRQGLDPYNYKILDLMKHNIYGSQRKMLELDNIIKRYQKDPRFRMAYIYNRLDEWMHNLRTLHYAMYKWRWYHLRVKRLIWYYEHSLRINIDITYSIEHLIHLHGEYMKKMEQLVPLETRQAMEIAKKQQRKQQKMREMGFPEGYIVAL